MEIAVIEKIKRLPVQTEESLHDAFSVLMHTEFVSRFFFSTNLPLYLQPFRKHFLLPVRKCANTRYNYPITYRRIMI